MSEATSTRPAPAPAAAAQPSPAAAHEIYLSPGQAFPTELAALELWRVQALHSRVCCQLEAEYRTVEGPHPVTLDRCMELREELKTRRHAPPRPAEGQ